MRLKSRQVSQIRLREGSEFLSWLHLTSLQALLDDATKSISSHWSSSSVLWCILELSWHRAAVESSLRQMSSSRPTRAEAEPTTEGSDMADLQLVEVYWLSQVGVSHHFKLLRWDPARNSNNITILSELMKQDHEDRSGSQAPETFTVSGGLDSLSLRPRRVSS